MSNVRKAKHGWVLILIFSLISIADVYKRQILETVWESRWLPD